MVFLQLTLCSVPRPQRLTQNTFNTEVVFPQLTSCSVPRPQRLMQNTFNTEVVFPQLTSCSVPRPQRLTQNTFNTEVVFPKRFRQVMAILLAKNDRSAVRGDVLPTDYAELK